MVAASFPRILTNAKIFKPPAHIGDAISATDALRLQTGAYRATLGAEFSTLRQLCLENTLTANGLPDASLIAAMLARHGAGSNRPLQAC